MRSNGQVLPLCRIRCNDVAFLRLVEMHAGQNVYITSYAARQFAAQPNAVPPRAAARLSPGASLPYGPRPRSLPLLLLPPLTQICPITPQANAGGHLLSSQASRSASLCSACPLGVYTRRDTRGGHHTRLCARSRLRCWYLVAPATDCELGAGSSETINA